MNGTAHAAARREAAVGGVYDGVDGESRDVDAAGDKVGRRHALR
jgi:hypothetical protein